MTLAEAERHVKKINRTYHTPKPASERSSGKPKSRSQEEDYGYDEKEELKERVPARTTASRTPVPARTPSARSSGGIRTAAGSRTPVSSPRPAASTRNLNTSKRQLPADEMRDRVLRVGEDHGSRKT